MRPAREQVRRSDQTYMIGSATWERRTLFKLEAWARLLIDTIYRYRGSGYHFACFCGYAGSLSLADHARFESGAGGPVREGIEIWQKGFPDHRIRDAEDYEIHVNYIHENPVRAGLCERAEQYPYSSAYAGFELDTVPQRLKAPALGAVRRG